LEPIGKEGVDLAAGGTADRSVVFTQVNRCGDRGAGITHPIDDGGEQIDRL